MTIQTYDITPTDLLRMMIVPYVWHNERVIFAPDDSISSMIDAVDRSWETIVNEYKTEVVLLREVLKWYADEDHWRLGAGTWEWAGESEDDPWVAARHTLDDPR